jgi:lipoyl(octanoyl) transferase
MNTRTPIEWRISNDFIPYPNAVSEMEERVAGILSGHSDEQVWMVQHPPLYTAGTSADDADLLDAHKFPVFQAGRGGEFTYHGPGQRVGYVMMDINQRGRDIRRFVRDLEEWMIVTLATFGVNGERREGRVGIWVDRGRHGGLPGQEDKIAAIGVRLRRWVSFHGVSLNICPDLSHYDGIVPCGISQHGVTSLRDLGVDATVEDVDIALKESFETAFGRSTVIPTGVS